ncbi:DNA topology modulation protein [Pseudalkalibacillus sp. Hm43]|uniref:DNA topology modulation protein n=1 Tax=Pseudalkalibacillus sp. Hm43 TaxID=3450742 RepID=UPI003F420BC1
MKKIAIIGSPGAGKSTLSRRLSVVSGIEVYHLDRLYWKPGWVESSREEIRRIQLELVQKDQWIIDGNFGSTMDIRLDAADTIVFLDIPRSKCFYRVIKRRLMFHGKSRPDMGEGCTERLDAAFLRYVWEFPVEKRVDILWKLAEYEGEKQVITLKNNQDIELFLELANQNRILQEEISTTGE